MNQGNELLREQAEQLRKNLDVLADRLDEISQLRSTQAATSTVQINAGGVGVWVASTACAVILAVTIVASVFLAIALSDLNRQAQELRQTDATIQAYINAGLVKPKEPEE